MPPSSTPGHRTSAHPRPLRRSAASAAAALALALVAGVLVVGSATGLPSAAAPTVRVVGNQLVDGAGSPIRLLGVNKAGGEFACVQGRGVFDGPVDDATVSTIRSWGANAVRLPLNEQCWLGINGMPASFSAQVYRDAVTAFVSRLNAAGIIAILDLHWSAPGTDPATSQQVMADADHAPAFWRSVAETFAANPSVVFDLYNEPHDITWQCWRDGCTTAAGWQAAGMQSLVDAVRSAGALQPLILSGTNWGGDLSQWLAYQPRDPLGQLVAGAHIYNFSQCNTPSCWDLTIGATASVIAVVTTEVGESTCSGAFTKSYLDWADRHGVGYTAWTWNTWDCGGPALISDDAGTPTALGAVVRDRLQALAASSAAPAASPSPAPTATNRRTSTLVYGFETTLSPWRAGTPGVTLGRSTYRPRAGRHAMTAVRRVAADSWSVLRVTAPGTALSRRAGRTVTAWVRLESRTPGSWKASLAIQRSARRWVAGPAVTLVPGMWTKVTLVVGTTTWPAHRALAVQVSGRRPTSGRVKVWVDEVRQSP